MARDTITAYGVTLRRLTHDKIEMVRQWRNHPKISRYMEFRDEITPEMQEKWFSKINSDRHLFYILENKGVEIGLINIKDISEGSGEGGIFVWDDASLNSDISFRGHLALFDEYFSATDNRQIISHVLRDNRRAQRFTEFLGFAKAPGQEEVNNQLYILKRETYLDNPNRQRYFNRFKQSAL